MKIAFCLFKYYPFGGLQRDFMRIAQACLVRGHEIHVYTMTWQDKPPNGLNVHVVPVRGFSNHTRCYSFAKKLQQLLANANYDVVFGFNRMPGLDMYFAADICFQALAEQKNGFWFKYTPRYKTYSSLEQALFEPGGKTQILYLTDNEKHTYQHYYHTEPERFQFVPPGIAKNTLDLQQRDNVKKNVLRELVLEHDTQHLVLMVGSDYKRKGVDRALRAMAALSHSLRTKSALLIVGKGRATPYNKLAKKLAIADHVHFLGTRDDVKALMLAADVLIHPAYFETAGMVLIEALTVGLPVLVTDNCGYAFHIERANAGHVIPTPFKQRSLNETLALMLAAPNQQTWRHNALKYAAKTDLYSLCDRTVDLIEAFFYKKRTIPIALQDARFI